MNSVVPAGDPTPVAANANDPPETAVVTAELVGRSVTNSETPVIVPALSVSVM